MTLLHRRPAPGKALPSPSHTALEPSPSPPDAPPSASLDSLPTELHLLIASHLPYPDALSLKHTSRHFYRLVDTGVQLKVAWLISRHELHLDCPNDSRCDLRNDSNFCRGSVRRLMHRRRHHIECESRPGLGCLVYGTDICARRRAALASRRWWYSLLKRGDAEWNPTAVLSSILVLVLALVILPMSWAISGGSLSTTPFNSLRSLAH
ncbi:hypothetical protein B0T11DRAFT_287043 [Plectosphaerella cucumerina]|uniref:F-box domain-containing protein n=1 Tax=Plectosphaerella cucumerina TaxID=40658 RepID=A0A8K0TDU2_9PEZI|nr:hypothetical protein B0T11DRAFT_287043 [Plectosphaerella cucumerina]